MSIIFQVGQIASNYIAAWVKDKKYIIIFKILSAVFNALAIISVGNFIAAIPVLFTIVRTIICLYKDKFKSSLPIWLCVIGYIVIAIFTVGKMESFIDILPTIVSLSASLIIWYCGPIGIKIGLGVTDSVWMMYYFSTGLYLSALNILLQTIVSIISIIRIKLEKKGK
jgi:hypothetical protein